MNDSSLLAFSLLPILLFLLYVVISLGVVIFLVVMILRFVKAHERIARQMEALVVQRAEEELGLEGAGGPQKK